MKISYRQMCIMVFMSQISLKFLALPSFLYLKSEMMSIFVPLVIMSVDAFYSFLILDLMKKSGEKNIYQFMKSFLGPVFSRIVLAVLLLKYLLVIFNIGKGLELFVIDNLYNELDWLVFLLPLLAVVGYMIYKGIRNIARVGEIVCWPIIAGIIYITFKSVAGVDAGAYFPFFHDGVMPLIESGYTRIAWFGSTTFSIMLFGTVDFTNEKKTKLLTYNIWAILLVEVVYFVFYGLFNVTSPTHAFCLSDVSQFTSQHTSIDELSWLIVSLWIIAQIVQLSLYSYCLMMTIKYIFGINSNFVPAVIIMIILVVLGLISKNTIGSELIFTSNIASIVTILAQYIVPLVLIVGNAIKNRKKKPKRQKQRRDYAEIKEVS